MSLIVQPVILSGGSGTRLWPLSREYYPKQLLALTSDLTLLQETVLRLHKVENSNKTPDRQLDITKPIIVCNEEHRFLVAEQLRQLGESAASIILEPMGRNTAPALTLAAVDNHSKDQDPVLLVMPADHVILDKTAFHNVVAKGAELASNGYLVTFGIVPTRPETGYGYIKEGAAIGGSSSSAEKHAYEIECFVEKPDKSTVKSYIKSGKYLWNSGMFMMRASCWIDAIKEYQPDIFYACNKAYEQGSLDGDFYRVDRSLFESCPDDSIDYAVMEKITANNSLSKLRSCVVPLDAGWSDVGEWSAIWEVSDRNEQGNVLKGQVYTHNTKNSLMISESRLVSVVGMEDVIVIESSDAVMVVHKSCAQDVKQIVNQLKKEQRPELKNHRRVSRPWGTYEGIDAGDRFQVKRIVVNPGETLSLQKHHHRAEHWIVVKGTANVTCGDKTFLLTENQSTYIPIGETHRLENPGIMPLELIEVQSGAYLGEDDIVRFEDVYGRDQ